MTRIRVNQKTLVSGHVRITNGSTVIEGRNKITKPFLIAWMNFLSGNTVTDNSGTMNRQGETPANTWVYLGTNTNTATNGSTTALTAPIGPTKSQFVKSTSWADSNKNYVQWVCTFFPGTVSGTVGEMGLYLYTKGDTLNAAGTVWTYNGSYLVARFAVADGEFESFTIDTTKPVVIVWSFKFESDGIIIQQGINGLSSQVAAFDEAGAVGCPCYQWTSLTTYMVLGTNTATGNTVGMTALVSPIGTAPGTKANTQSFSTTAVGEGNYKLTLSAVWNAGTVSGTVGEIGLYLHGAQTTYTGTGAFSPSILFFARMSHADEHFTSFAIDTGKNLTITWEISMVFQ